MTDQPERPRVAVVIRNRNERAALEVVLVALEAQTEPAEIVVVDNGSTDGSLEVAEAHGATVVHISPDEFSYGRALNRGLAATDRPICVLLSAHSVPAHPEFLAACVRGVEGEGVLAARCEKAATADRTRWLAPATLDSTTPLEEILARGPVANGAVLRRSAWELVPFDETLVANEDKLWAAEILETGGQILSPIPAVYHYLGPEAPSPIAEERRRYRDIAAVYKARGARVSVAGEPLGRVARRAARDVLLALPSQMLRRSAASVLGVWYHVRLPVIADELEPASVASSSTTSTRPAGWPTRRRRRRR